MNKKYKTILPGRPELIMITAVILALLASFMVVASAKSSSGNTEKPEKNSIAYEVPIHTLGILPITFSEAPEHKEAWQPNEDDVIMIAKTLYGECRGVKSKMEQAAVAWCILNRVDSKGYACGESIEYVVTFPHQFAYDPDAPVWESLKEIAYDVLIRWHNEKQGAENVGRVLPAEYLYFIGDGKRNHFSIEWKSTEYWNWSLTNPYED